jgi:hypothetical protein
VEYIDREEVFEAIQKERIRQEEIHPLPKRKIHENEDLNAVTSWIYYNEFLVVLTEEFLEVVHALQGEGSLKEELIHVAAVCSRWLENLK